MSRKALKNKPPFPGKVDRIRKPVSRKISSRIRTCKVLSAPEKLRTSKLGWSTDMALEARARLISFEEDWGSPGMEDYDRL